MASRLIYLVRHGAARGAAGRALGHTDLLLSAAGRRTVERLAATWEGPPPARLLASPLARAAASAAVLSAAWGRDAETDPRLAEMSFGEWDGRAWDEVHAADGERFAAWAERWWEAAVPGGEGFGDLERRVGEWWDEAAAATAATTVAVTHAGPIRALLAGRLGFRREDLWDLPIGLARVSALAVGAGGSPRVLFLDRPDFQPRGAPSTRSEPVG